MPSIRSLASGGGLLATLALVAPVAAQSPDAGTELGLQTRIGIRFGVSLVINLLLGGALLALGPQYAADAVRDLRDDPGGAFGWGLLVGLVVPIALVLLAFTIIGLVVAIPGFLVLVFVGIVGNAVTVVWVGSSLLGASSALTSTAVAAGAVALALVNAVPVLGNFVATLIGFFGMGVVGRSLYDSWRD